MAQHVERLFSEAYDSALSPQARVQFEAHLAECAQCRSAYDDYRVALSAVSELPQTRMPIAVVLPATPPQLEPGPMQRLSNLLAGLRRPRALAAVAGIAAVGVAAVTIAVRANHGSNSGGNLALGADATNGAGGRAQSAAPQFGGAAGGSAPQALVQCIPSAEPSVAPIPSNFANGNVVNDSSRPGEQLIVATERRTYSAGSTVLVYARLVTPQASAPAYLPCVVLQQPALGNAAAPSSIYKFAPIPGIAASPTSTGDKSSAPLLSVTIPQGTPRGTVLHIVASIPANVPAGSATQLVADLTITVT